MVDRTAISLDDFVGTLGSGALPESEQETVETTQEGDPSPEGKDEAVEADAVEAEGGDDEPAEQLAEEEDDVEAAEATEADADDEEEDGEVEDAEAESGEDEDVDVEDDEEVQEKSFQWDDALEVDVPGLGKTTLEELRRNHLREADYQRKTQAIADEKRALTAEAEKQSKALEDERQLLTQRREALEATLDVMRQEMSDSRPSLEERKRLLEEDPDEYHRQQLRWEQQGEKLKEYEKQVAEAAEEQKKADKVKEDELRQQEQAFVAEQRDALLGKMPDWQDQAKMDEAMASFIPMIEAYGFDANDLYNTIDHRQLVLLNAFKGAQDENARLKTELSKTRKKANKVEKAKPALKKKVQASPKRIRPVSSAPAEPKDKAAAFLETVKKQSGGTLTIKQMAEYENLRRQA